MQTSIQSLRPFQSQKRTTWDNDSILGDSKSYFFYPGGRDDFAPLRLFADQDLFSYFVYCDYHDDFFSYVRNVHNNLPPRGFDEFEVLESVELGPGRNPISGTMRQWKDYYHSDWGIGGRDTGFGDNQVGGAFRFKLRTPGQKEIYLYYFGTEAIGTAKILNDTCGVPKCVVVQNCGLGGYWADFGGESLLYRVYRPFDRRPQRMPMIYLDNLTAAWPDYVLVSEPDDQVYGSKSIYNQRYQRPELSTRRI